MQAIDKQENHSDQISHVEKCGFFVLLVDTRSIKCYCTITLNTSYLDTMSFLDGVISGVKKVPVKVFIYGDNGVGKSTFCSGAPSPIFLDFDWNLDHISSDRVMCKELNKVETLIEGLLKENHAYKTIVIDSVDGLEKMVCKALLKAYNKKNMNDGKFGELYTIAAEKMNDVFRKIHLLFEERSMNVLVTGHATIKEIRPDVNNYYNTIAPTIRDKYAEFMKDSFNCILYAKKLSEKNERIGLVLPKTERKIFTSQCSEFIAKNVFELPDTLPVEWSAFEQNVNDFFDRKMKKG